MTRFVLGPCVFLTALVLGCSELLGINDHTLRGSSGGMAGTGAGGEGGKPADAGSGGALGGGGAMGEAGYSASCGMADDDALGFPDSFTALCSDGVQATDCSSAPAGQDGNVRVALPLYEGSAGRVRDKRIGIEWATEISDSTLTFYEAKAYCAGLGASLPLVSELVSLLDYGRLPQSGQSLLCDGVFPSGQVGMHWSSEPLDDAGLAVDIASGVGDFGRSFDEPAYARCKYTSFVPEYEPHDEVPSEPTVVVSPSYLEWMKTPLLEAAWLDAVEYCNSLQYAGKDDWRLPSIKELLTILDWSRNPHIDPSFLLEPSDNNLDKTAWSSTPNAEDPGQFWAVDFQIGRFSASFELEHTVRCVRTSMAD